MMQAASHVMPSDIPPLADEEQALTFRISADLENAPFC